MNFKKPHPGTHALWGILTVLLFPAGALTASNTPPTAVADSAATHARSGALIDLLANDQDPDGDPLSVSILGAPSFGSAVEHGDGTVTYSPDPALFEGSGGDSFSYQVDDGRGGAASAMVTVLELPVPVAARPIPQPVVLLSEDFNDGTLDGWSPVDHPNATGGPSNWSAVGGYASQTTNIGGDGGTFAVYAGGFNWTDYKVRVAMWSGDDDAISVAFRYQDVNNYYALYWSNWWAEQWLFKQQGGTWSVVASKPATHRIWDPYLVEITVQGANIRVDVDGETLFDVVDATFSSGTIALQSDFNTGSYFDDVQVTLPPMEGPLLLAEDFEDGDIAGWKILDAGASLYPSSWQIVSGELIQSSNISGALFPGVAGTNAVFQDGWNWTDYRFRVLTRGGDDDSIILYFRFQDLQNHYAFHWNRQGNVRLLRKVVEGQIEDLAIASGGYGSGKDYLIDIVADGPHLELSIDGKPIFSVDDDAHRSGTVVLACEAMAGVAFDNIRVTAIR